MAIQSSVQPDARTDARGRADEYNREYIATEGGNQPTRLNKKAQRGAFDDLLQRVGKSAQTLRHTAESVENRGLKLLLKVLAQERVHMFNRLRQASGMEVADPLENANKSSATSLQHGLQDIQTSMTVQREGREDVALTHLVEEEGKLLAAYATVLEGDIADSQRINLEAQRARIAQFHARMKRVEIGVDPIVARVFDTRIEGESAVARLQERGLDVSQIDAAPISQLARPLHSTTVASSSPINTIAAGALSGGIVGALAGLALAVFVWLAPNLVGWVTVGPWALLLGAIAIGAVFGAVFGLFIGQSQREDDAAVTADGLIHGEILVVAYPQPQQVSMVEDILQVQHERELSS